MNRAFSETKLHKKMVICVDINKDMFLFSHLKILRALKIWSIRAQIWALENLWEPSKILCKGPKWPLKYFAYFNPWCCMLITCNLNPFTMIMDYAFSGRFWSLLQTYLYSTCICFANVFFNNDSSSFLVW